jgi:acetyl/propionyl-CoA carboxylase alpha subunit
LAYHRKQFPPFGTNQLPKALLKGYMFHCVSDSSGITDNEMKAKNLADFIKYPVIITAGAGGGGN